MTSRASDDRPRERLARVGAAALGDAELMALVLGAGTGPRSALDVANELLELTGGVHSVARMSSDELCRLDGIGSAKAAQLLAAIELGRRTLVRPVTGRVQLDAPRKVAAFLLPQFGSRPVEHFGIVLLDLKHRLIRTAIISVGTLEGSFAHPREVFREAAAGHAGGIVLFHNHPSGDPTPSVDDVHVTRRLCAAGELMGIPVIDHVVLADNTYRSLKELGELP